MRYILIILILIKTSDLFSQVNDTVSKKNEISAPTNTDIFQENDSNYEIMIDPIQAFCYEIYPDSPIRRYHNNTEYIGRVIFNTKVDTNNLSLTDYKIVFAKLYLRNNPQDSIEIRLENKIGNYEYLERIEPMLIEHLKYIRFKKNDYKNCINSDYIIPLLLE